MRKILSREQYLDTVRKQVYTKYTGVPKSNEAFTNDVNWGDSWVGRLINSVSRKIKIKFNLKRIDSLADRLKGLFSEMVDSSKIEAPYGLSEYISTSYILGELENSINGEEEEEDVSDVISLIRDLINQIKSYNLENAEELLNPLEEFRKFLEGLEKSEDSEDSEESEEEGVTENEIDGE